MHSRFAPQGLPTWGRADLDGDGSPDLVVVRPSGLVTARVGGRTLRIRLPRDRTSRLQGMTDLTGDRRADILVASTATGCSTGYRLCSSGATVLTIVDRHLRVVRFVDGRHQGGRAEWDNGEGDLYEGWVCGRHGATQRELLRTTNGYRRIRTMYRVTGLRARPVSRTITYGTPWRPRLTALTATWCGGLDAWGWAPERGPRG